MTSLRTLLARRGAVPGLVVLGLTILAAVAVGSYLRRGGFIYDDWSVQARLRLDGFWGLASHLIDNTAGRPLMALYFPIVHTVLGTHEHLHLVLVAGLRIGLSLLLFLLLRELGLDRLSAAAAAALALLFPFADATLLWSSTGHITLAISLWLAGVLVALRALRRGGAPRLHALAVVLYLASILLYEIALLAVVLSGLLYVGRAPRRDVLRRWAADVVVVGVAVLLFTSRVVHLLGARDTHTALGPRAALEHLGTIADQGLTVAARTLVPFGAPDRVAVGLGVLLLLAAAIVVARRAPDPELRRELALWLRACVVGAAIVAAGWAVLAVADPYYTPFGVGIGNRTNALAGVGLVVLVVALFRVAATLAFGGMGAGRGRAAAVLTLVLSVAVGGSYLGDVRTDREAWVRARQREQIVLNTIVPTGRPPVGTTVIARGFDLYAAPGVPVFSAFWDLRGALRLRWHERLSQAWPAAPGAITCGPASVTVVGMNQPPARYGRALLVDVRTARATPIDTLATCRALARAG